MCARCYLLACRYSLAVQMGSDTKSHLLPHGVRRKLMAIAMSVKKKHRAQQEAEAAAAGGGKRKASAQQLAEVLGGAMAHPMATQPSLSASGHQ